jgi:uncharacterized protein (DUF1684 family)
LWYNTPMMKHMATVASRSIVTAMLLCAAACARAPMPVDPAYAAEIDAWRNQRLSRLTAEDGWLTLTGLYWLEPGENRFGSAADSAVVLPDENLPEIAGFLLVGADGGVVAMAEPEAGVLVNGETLTTTELATDAQGKPDILSAGRISFHVIDREGKLAARVKDPEAPTRLAFAGIEHFPINQAYRVEARLEPYDAPREVAIPTVLGQDTTMIAPGLLHFEIDGREMTLEPYLESPEDENYFLIFRDATSAETSYGAGRFLSSEAADEKGKTVLDFNLAYNPPCAFTPFATCPLPPPQNWLQFPIEAGEMYSGPAH